MKGIVKLIRSQIRALKPYQSARKIAQETGFTGNIYLDANLNPFMPYPGDQTTKGFNHYSEPQPVELIEQLAQAYKVDNNNLLITRGSDEGIDLLIRAFVEPNKDSIVISKPTFGMYETYAQIQGAKVFDVPLVKEKGYQLDIENILKVCQNNSVKLIFIPNPQAPMGHMIDVADILQLCEKLADRVVIVIDEAYLEFTENDSIFRYNAKYNNLVVLRTLSKAYAMAGLRIGALLACPELIDILRNILAPYPLCVPSINFALRALQPEGIKQTKVHIKELVTQRDIMINKLKTLPYVKKVFPSVTNFILIEVEDCEYVLNYVKQHGILLRSQNNQLKNTIRISMGTRDENNKLWEVLENLR